MGNGIPIGFVAGILAVAVARGVRKVLEFLKNHFNTVRDLKDRLERTEKSFGTAFYHLRARVEQLEPQEKSDTKA